MTTPNPDESPLRRLGRVHYERAEEARKNVGCILKGIESLAAIGGRAVKSHSIRKAFWIKVDRKKMAKLIQELDHEVHSYLIHADAQILLVQAESETTKT